MATNPDLLKSLLHQGAILPKEEMLEIKPKKDNCLLAFRKRPRFKNVALP